MVEIFAILALSLIAIYSEKVKAIQLMLFLLPFHSFIKNLFLYYQGGGTIFANWKEIITIILAIRVITNKNEDKTILLGSHIYLAIILLYCINSNDLFIALPSVRDHIFPIIMFLTVYNIRINPTIIKPIAISLTTSAFLHGIMGYVQAFWLNIPISIVMNRIDFIDNNGYIQYKTNSARILGFERMAGILGGGPNGFGLFFGFMVVFLTNLLIYEYTGLSKKMIFFLKLTLVLSVTSLIFSFSRAGWFVSIVGTIITFKFYKVRFKISYVLLAISIFSVFTLLLNIYFPWANEIIISSFTGKEESAADRGNNFINALIVNVIEPWGHGIGTTDIRNKGNLFFAESAFMNIMYEIGLAGIFYLIIFHISIMTKILKLKYFDLLPFSKLAVSVSIPTLIVSFFSINSYGMPYIYLWWIVLGLGCNDSFLKVYVSKSKNKLY